MIDAKLQTFLCLCETKSYTKTAEILYITQPSVTNHIHLLEKMYKTKLFTSSNKNFGLTKAGILLRDYALKLKAMDNEFERIIKNINEKKNKFNFASTKNVINIFVKNFLPLWVRNNHDIEYNISVLDKDKILNSLDNGSIDFAIIDYSLNNEDYISKEIFKSKIMIAVSQDSPLSFHKKIKLSTIIPETLICDDLNNGKMQFIEQQLNNKNLSLNKFKKINQVDDMDVILNLIKEDLGVGLIYEQEGLEEFKHQNISLIELADIKDNVPFYFVYNKNNLQKELLEQLSNEFIKLYKVASHL